ncbi:uncharacterized protein LOC143593694 [Bidens hawaiensis]|uniref:uncharacterized protein LOC143593694 n=1 Tax=Bidens hawaiensis TaxID=980011 RepID=UPI004049A431
MVEATEENFTDDRDYAKFVKLIEDAVKPFYKGCPNFKKLSALVQLFNVKSKYGVSDKCFTEFILVFKKMLPEGNEMTSSKCEVKRTFKAMGSAKVLWYFPIIPRLKRLFQSPTTARHLRWHAESRIKDGVLRPPVDSPAWAAIDDGYEFIKQDPRSLRLGIAANGVDVNRGNRHHSVWPVLAVIYNLPPWLCMKRNLIMLSILISGTPGNDIDVFLAPLIEYLQQLFNMGVETYDAYARERFTLHAVVLWTIKDYPSLGTLCGCPYSGFFGCVVCGKETNCVRLKRSNKQSYGGYIRYLPYDHPFRKKKKGFNGTQEFLNEPIPKNWVEIYNKMQYCINIWGKGHRNNVSDMQQDSNGRGGKIKKQRGTRESDTTKKAATEIEVEEVDKLEADLFVTLCLLEKYFPPSFFDVMVHLTVHISREVKLCGPVCFRWMYPFNRCMEVIMGHARNKNKIEGCIAEQNVAKETIEFLREFKKDLKTIGIPNSLRNLIEK